jgi:hypothetical protein
MITVILSLILILSLSSFIILFLSYKKLKNRYNEIIEVLKKPTLRHGYFETPLISTDATSKIETTFNPVVYVKELDRYTNGTCEVEIVKIIPKISSEKQSHNKVFKYIKDNFSPIMKISEITWIESEIEIKEIRKNKIKNILKNINNNN